jgi:beta-glucanase (GH16 family)
MARQARMHLGSSWEREEASSVSAPPEQDSTQAPSDSYHEEREELQRVLNDPEFSRSANLVRFLAYICNKYFDGRADEIREYSIAVEALGRRESSFDSHVDPIVRVTARSLRKKLSELYNTDWTDHPLQIVLPLGHYVPEFVRRDDTRQLADTGLLDAAENESSAAAASDSVDRAPELLAVRARVLGILRNSILKLALGLAAATGVFVAGYFWGTHTKRIEPPTTRSFQWGEPVWSDEFNGPAQQLPDPANWTYDTGSQDELGNQGWGNREMETYCSPGGANPPGCDPHRPNAFLDGNGHLVLRAMRSPDGRWTSARITTRGLKEFQYGRIEARMKLPVGTGLWPAFWMLGSNYLTTGWPASGSVTIVENVGLTPRSNGLGPSIIRATLHGPRYFGGNGLWHDFKLPNGGRVDDGNFHTYGVIWSQGMIQFYVDDPANIFFVRDSSDLPEGGEWVFDHPFFLVMDLAVGGDWPGNPNSTTLSPADLLVDYVRVYKIPKVPAPTIQWQPVVAYDGSSVASVIALRAQNYSGRVHLSCSVEPATAACALASSVVDLSNTLSQDDSLTISTNLFTDQGRVVSPPGRYKLTITATTISGDHSQLTEPFEVKAE